jgi:hypothetical protein
MSALGQKQTLKRLRTMSALPPKADIAELEEHVRFVLSAQPVDATQASNLVRLEFRAQSLAQPFIELPSHSVEPRMRIASGSTTLPWPPH